MEDSSLRLIYDCRFGKCRPQFRRLTNMLIKVRNGVLTHRDVKNEGTSGDVYENKGQETKCTHINTAFYTKMHELRDNERQSIGLFGRTCADHAINRSEVVPLEPALSGSESCRRRHDDACKIGPKTGQHVGGRILRPRIVLLDQGASRLDSEQAEQIRVEVSTRNRTRQAEALPGIAAQK
jgi:hypothetical protein